MTQLYERVLQQDTPNEIPYELCETLSEQGLRKCLDVIIDEYDHFANNILSQGKEMFKNLVKTDGRSPLFGDQALEEGMFTQIVEPCASNTE